MSNTLPMQRLPRVLFLGMQGHFSPPSLRALLDNGIEVSAVIVPASQPSGPGLPAIRRREQPCTSRLILPLLHASVLQLAWAQHIPLWEVQRISDSEAISVLAAYQPDIICVSCFPQRIPRAILDLPRLGCLNVHPSLLPANRGPVPLFWTFREGYEQTGVTIHLMDEAMDSGAILAQEPIKVPDGISYAQLESQCALRGGELLAQMVWDLYRGRVMPVPQDETKSSYHPFPSAQDFVVYPAQWSARHVYNFFCGIAYWSDQIKLYIDGEYVLVQEAISYSLEDMDQTFGDHACHPERSEGSGSTDTEILRCAQDDSQDTAQVMSPSSVAKGRSSLLSKYLDMDKIPGGTSSELWIRCKVGWVKVKTK